ncbi:MAG: RraA family protein, partial [Lachnospiraceae bacterium]|nr:RraA family protein [Lachnospiraceae bacterium]
HCTTAVQAVNVPVSICSMDVAPGEVIHMDENGAVKFPAAYLERVLEHARLMKQRDKKRQEAMRKTVEAEGLAAIMKGIYQ